MFGPAGSRRLNRTCNILALPELRALQLHTYGQFSKDIISACSSVCFGGSLKPGRVECDENAL